MPLDDDEPDYLARTQLPYDPGSFSRAVKEAFHLEHGCIENQDIAAVLGVDNSRISQIFKNPEKLKPESIKNLTDALKSRKHQRRIIRAWLLESLDVDIEKRPRGPLVGSEVSEKTLKRVDRQIREQRLIVAAYTAREAA